MQTHDNGPAVGAYGIQTFTLNSFATLEGDYTEEHVYQIGLFPKVQVDNSIQTCEQEFIVQVAQTTEMTLTDIPLEEANEISSENFCTEPFTPSGTSLVSQAFAWDANTPTDLPNVHYAVVINTAAGLCSSGPCTRMIGFDFLTSETNEEMTNIVSTVNAHPVGHRAIHPHNIYLMMEYTGDPSLAYDGNFWKVRWRDKFANGQENIWFDDWTTQGYEKMQNWFAAYRAAGGNLDILIVDFERDVAVYDITRTQFNSNHAQIRNWAEEVVADPRWPEIKTRLNTKAIAAGYNPVEVNFNDISDISTWGPTDPRTFVWNDVMHERVVEALNHILFDAARTHFPAVRGSEYNAYLRKSDTHRFGQYIISGHNSPVGRGTIVGTHSAKESYGTIPSQFYVQELTAYDPPTGPLRNWHAPRENDAFESFIFSHRLFRGMRSVDFSIPISAWISGDRPYGAYTSAWLTSGYADSNDWYHENIFHLGLLGVKDFLLYNDGRSSDGSGELMVSNTLNELDTMIGFASRESAPVLTLDAPNWDTDKYVLTGMRINGWDIYRFTPRFPATVTSNCPATFNVEGDEITPVEGAKIYTPTNRQSNLGYWLVKQS